MGESSIRDNALLIRVVCDIGVWRQQIA